MNTNSPPVLTIDHVSKRFGDLQALRDVCVTLAPGELVAVIGRSGAGKTTFLRCLACFTPVTEGRIRFADQDLATLRGAALRRHRCCVGMIYQQFNLVRRLRVIDNVLVGRLGHLAGWQAWAALFRRFESRETEIALRCLDHVGLLDRAWQRTDTLSGGEQQRVAIAKILAQDPSLILADEPIASLDLVNGELVMGTLRRIARDLGLSVVATLHHVDFARRYADRVLGFQAGRLVFDGIPADLCDEALRELFGTGPADSPPPEVQPIAAFQLVTS